MSEWMRRRETENWTRLFSEVVCDKDSGNAMIEVVERTERLRRWWAKTGGASRVNAGVTWSTGSASSWTATSVR